MKQNDLYGNMVVTNQHRETTTKENHTNDLSSIALKTAENSNFSSPTKCDPSLVVCSVTKINVLFLSSLYKRHFFALDHAAARLAGSTKPLISKHSVHKFARNSNALVQQNKFTTKIK